MILSLKRVILLIPQVVRRLFTRNGVYFPYEDLYTHRSFHRWYIGDRKYSNLFFSKLNHFINSPQLTIKQPYFIEVNDHPLSLHRFFKIPSNRVDLILKSIETMKALYESDNCKFILVPCDGFRDLIYYYFKSPIVTNKIKIVAGLGCIPKVNVNYNWEGTTKFLFLASDFFLKGVDLVLEAWTKVDSTCCAHFTLVCPNVSDDYKERILFFKNFTLIEDAPLSDLRKRDLFLTHNVSLAFTHVHGGANIYEAIEFGHAIVYSEFHSTVHSNYGLELKVPYHYYSKEYYGLRWNNIDDYLKVLNFDKANGVFNDTIISIANIFVSLAINKSYLKELSDSAWSYARGHYSLKRRYEILDELYDKFK